MLAGLVALVVGQSSGLVAAARDQLSWGTVYDPSYVRLSYPGGDVPRGRGVCTDVLIRALRAVGYDLQRLVHEDARRNRKAYPMIRRLDPNIDHRRVPNLVVFFTRHGLSSGDAHWRPGDFVRWKLPSGRDHVGILTDRRGPSGDWGVIHNLSRPAEEDCLHAWRVVGHFRYPVAR